MELSGYARKHREQMTDVSAGKFSNNKFWLANTSETGASSWQAGVMKSVRVVQRANLRKAETGSREQASSWRLHLDNR